VGLIHLSGALWECYQFVDKIGNVFDVQVLFYTLPNYSFRALQLYSLKALQPYSFTALQLHSFTAS